MEAEKTGAGENLGTISEGYDRFWDQLVTPGDYWANDPSSFRTRALGLIPKEVKAILDLGCGNGEAMRFLSKRGASLCGIDISLSALKKAKGSGEVLKADITKIPIADGSFDCVLVLDVFEHVIDKKALMMEIHRVLSESGMAIMTIPLPSATEGHGDPRQPYDKPIEYGRFMEMSSGLFDLESSFGWSWIPLLPRMLETYIPLRVGFALFKAFPCLTDRSGMVLVVLRKRR